MRVTRFVLGLAFFATSAFAADPVYLDELIEMPLATLQRSFPDLRKEGCYQIGPDRYLLLSIDKKDQKPWRVVLAAQPPCRRAEQGPQFDVRVRNGVELGAGLADVVAKTGRPETAAHPDEAGRRFGEMEYFFICRVSEGCARHTSVYFRDGTVSAVSEWYSE